MLSPQTYCCRAVSLSLPVLAESTLLREALSDVMDDYDYIMIDTPPALSILTINAYTAADELDYSDDSRDTQPAGNSTA